MTPNDADTGVSRRKTRSAGLGDAAPAGLVLFDRHRRVVAMSPRAATAFALAGLAVDFADTYSDVVKRLTSGGGQPVSDRSALHLHSDTIDGALCVRTAETDDNLRLLTLATTGENFACIADRPSRIAAVAPQRLSASPGILRHHEVDGSNVEASSWLAEIDPPDRPSALEGLERCRAGRSLEFAINRSPVMAIGGGTASRTHCWPLYDSDGRLAHLICREDSSSTAGAAVGDPYRHLVEMLPDSVLVVQSDVTVFANDSAARFFGTVGVPELLGRRLEELVATQDVPALEAMRDECLAAGGEPRAAEIVCGPDPQKAARGEFLLRGIVWRGCAAEMVVIRNIEHDVGTDAALRESEIRFAAVAENMPGTVYQRKEDTQGRISFPFISSGVWETHRLKAEDVVHDPARMLRTIHEDSYAAYREALRRSRETLTPFDCELRTIRADGKEVWIRSIAHPRRMADGSTLWDGVMVDMTAQKRAEEALRENEGFLRLIADALPVRITYVDSGQIIRFVNKAAAEWFRRPVGEVTGRTLREIFGGAIYAEIGSRVDRALRGQSISYQAWVDHPEFGRRFLRMHYLSDIGPDGAVRGYVHLSSDITDEKRAQTVLLESKELAEKANADKSAFLRAAGHDLRQPAQAISLLCYAMSEYVTAPVGRAILDDLDRAVRGMHSLLSGVLGYSQLEDGNVEPYIGDFPLSEVFDQMRSEFELVAKQKKIELRIVASRHLVRSDVALLNRVVQNLVSNAMKYTERGRVLLGARRVGNRIRIEVWDTGRGIPEDQFDKIFREFYQIKSPSSQYVAGLGLGLAIVDKTARLLGHEVCVRSEIGRGTVFSILIEAANPHSVLSAS